LPVNSGYSFVTSTSTHQTSCGEASQNNRLKKAHKMTRHADEKAGAGFGQHLQTNQVIS